MQPMEVLREWVMSYLNSIHLEMVLLSVQDCCTVCGKHPMAQKSFWTHQMVLLGDEAQGKLISVCLEIVLIFTQDRCMVCVERTIGSEIVLDAPDGTPR